MRAVVLGLLLWMFAGAALAEVQLSFYAHPGARVRDGYLLFPHAYVHATGTIETTGEVVDWSAGFTAASPGPHLLFVKGPGVVEEPDARYVSEGQGFLTVVLDDAAFLAIRERAEWWNSPEGRTYDLRRRNCITFIADLARLAGLTTAREPSMRPGGFLEATAALNPGAVWRPDPITVTAPPIPSPLEGEGGPEGRMRGKPATRSPSDILRTDTYPSSERLRRPPSPPRGERR